ncbi:olfactory receptor 5P52-like [Dendrobates tinctorius]|uniref:olfactory receptor 5P52-like n=1 Tax=Dendrobates tinctorius TaxID=92724 RepID=UPI003CCA3CFB
MSEKDQAKTAFIIPMGLFEFNRIPFGLENAQVFWVTLCGNLLIITLVSTSKNLHTPMYFFISQLSIKLFECLLLTVMSYDRYVAICNPLRYTTIMTDGLYLRLEISCSDAFPIKLLICLGSIAFVIIPSVIIVISYGNIVRAVLEIQSNVSRQKAFSTCSSHLAVVFIFYLTLFSVYTFLAKAEPDINKIISLLYTVVTPLVNPIIYSFRNKDINKAVQEAILKYL